MSALAERIAFDAGVKPALRLLIAPERAQSVRRRWGDAFVALGGELSPGRVLAYASREPELAEELADAERIVFDHMSRTPTPELLSAHRRLGAGLGYPSCCVEAFVGRVERGVTQLPDGSFAHEDYVALVDALMRSEAWYGRLNVLRRRERVHLISHYPCRFDCPRSLAYARLVLSALVERDSPTAAREFRASLMRPVSLSREGRIDEPGPGVIELLFDRF